MQESCYFWKVPEKNGGDNKKPNFRVGDYHFVLSSTLQVVFSFTQALYDRLAWGWSLSGSNGRTAQEGTEGT